MSNFFETLRKKLQVWHEQRAERIEAERQALLDAEAREAVQVMEFNGRLYIFKLMSLPVDFLLNADQK